jgi:hypothetical protein
MLSKLELLTRSEDYRLRVVKSMLVQQVGYLIRENEVTGCWGKVHNEQLRDLYSPRNITAVIRSR